MQFDIHRPMQMYMHMQLRKDECRHACQWRTSWMSVERGRLSRALATLVYVNIQVRMCVCSAYACESAWVSMCVCVCPDRLPQCYACPAAGHSTRHVHVHAHAHVNAHAHRRDGRAVPCSRPLRPRGPSCRRQHPRREPPAVCVCACTCSYTQRGLHVRVCVSEHIDAAVYARASK